MVRIRWLGLASGSLHSLAAHGSPNLSYCSRLSELTSTQVHDASRLTGTRNYVYSLDLPTNPAETRPLNFTLRFKPDAKDSWIWIKDTARLDDGQLLFQTPDSVLQQKATFESLFSGTDSALTAKRGRSQVTGVEVFQVSGVAPVKRNEWSTALLGYPTDLERFYATVRLGYSNPQRCFY